MPQVERVIVDFVENELASGNQVTLTEHTNLLEEDVLDSLGIVLLIDHLQEAFGVAIPAEEVVLANFSTIAAITGLLTKLGADTSPETG